MTFSNLPRFASAASGAPLLGLPFAAGHAAEGSKLEQAQANTTKVIAALKAAEGAKTAADYEMHRKKAVDDSLKRANGEILKAKSE